MSGTSGTVTLTIGGRNYTVACAPGEEDHITKLAAAIDAKVRQLGGSRSPQDSQNLLFAGLLLADELHETGEKLANTKQPSGKENGRFDAERAQLKNTIASLEQDLATARSAVTDVQSAAADQQNALPAQIAASDHPDMAPSLERFAQLLEECADKLEAKAR